MTAYACAIVLSNILSDHYSLFQGAASANSFREEHASIPSNDLKKKKNKGHLAGGRKLADWREWSLLHSAVQISSHFPLTIGRPVILAVVLSCWVPGAT